MKHEDHLAVDIIVFGKPYPEVHKWIDSDFKNWVGGNHSLFNHWLKYHHMSAIVEKYDREKQPIKYAVACLHIICDWMSHFGRFKLPINEYTLRRLLEEEGVKLFG